MKSQRRVLGASLIFSFLVLAPPVQANPEGGTVVGGAARFDRLPGRLTINQGSDRLIINWRSFSIGAGETTKFVQPSASSAALNRVLSGDPSRIYGNLEANGRVFLINPNGVLVGKGATVNTHGFVASTLDVSDASFLSGARLTLSGDSTAAVVNEGAIEAIGGDVFLIGRTVENSGSIRAANGTVGLAAGSEVIIVPTGRERVSVIAGNADGAPAGTGVKNVGTIEAVSAELKAAGGNIYALAINNGGIVRATGVRREGGRVILTSDGGNIENSGTLSAQNANGSGGTIVVAGGHNDQSPATVINSGVIEARGEAEGTRGGRVVLTGDHVGLFGSGLIDVSGHSGGGIAQVGGGYQGNVSSIQNADGTFIGQDAVIKADATVRGDGGRVVVWANGVTRFYGTISARGGAEGGNGGFAEVSGKESLEYRGSTDLTAPLGRIGTLLLDPKFIIISSSGTDPVAANDAFNENPTGTSTISPTDLATALNGADVTLRANTDITISDAVDSSASANNLILRAGRSIIDNANITVGGSFSATFNDSGADAVNRDAGAAVFTMANGITITAPGGIAIQGGTLADQSDGVGGTVTVGIAANTGNIQIENLDSRGAAAGSTTSDGNAGGAISVANNAAAGKAITISGTVDSRGSSGGGSGNNNGGAGGGVTIDASGALSVAGIDTSAGNGDGTGNGGNAGAIDLTGGTGITLNGDITAHAGTGSPNGNDGTLTLTATAGGVSQAGGSVDLGSAGNAGTLAKLGRLVLAGAGTFQIDRNANDLPRVTADVTGPIDLRSAGDLTVENRVRSGNNPIDISTVNGSITVVNDVLGADLDAGTSTISLSAGSSGNDNAITILGGVAATGGITFEADHMTLTPDVSGIQVGSGTALLRPFESGTLIDFGGANAAGTLGLTDGELDNVTAGTITVGSVNAGTITASADVTQGAKDINLITGGGITFNNGVRLTTSGDVSLTSGGAITGNGGGANVDAATLSATAQTGITLDTTIGTLTLASVLGTGNISISDSDDLAVTDAHTANGNITLAADGNLTVTAATAGTGTPGASGNGNIQLTTTSGGDIGVGLLTATADGVTINAAGSVTDGNGATENVVADTLSVTSSGGAGINLDTMITTLTLATASGSGDIDINDLTGDLAIGTVTAANDTVTLTSAGSITDANAGAVNVTAGNLSATAQSGIDLDTDITTLTLANVLGAGAINISDADGLIVTDAHTFDGNITLAAAGDLVVTAVTAGTGAPAASGNGNIQLTTTAGGDVDLGIATAAADGVTINAAGAVTDGNGATENVVADTLSVTAGGGSGINLDTKIATLTLATAGGSGDIDINDLTGDLSVGTVTATGDTVTLTSAGAITDGNGGAVNVTAGNLSATAQSGINLDTDITTLTLASVLAAGAIDISDASGLTVTDAQTFDGNITLAAAGNLTVTAATAGTGVPANAGNGNIQLTTTSGGDVDVGVVTATADGVTINAAGAVTDGNGGAVNVIADTLSATAQSGINLDTTITTLTLANVLGTGDINISDSAGGLTVTSASTGTGGDVILAAAGGVLDVVSATAGGSGDIQLTTTGGGNVNVGVVTASGDTVTINSSGAITDGNGAAANVVAANLSATAQTGIDLDTDITTLTLASVLGAGNIDIADVDGLVVTSALTDSGDITLSAAGDLTVTAATAGTGAPAASGNGNIQLTATGSGSDIAVGNVTAAGDGITVTSAGNVTDSQTDGAADLTANTISVTAGAGASIGTAGNPLGIGGAVGNVDLTAQSGAVHVNAQSTGTPDVNITDATGNANINRTEFKQGGRTYTSIYANSAAGNFTIQTGGNITEDAGVVVASAGTLALRAGGSIGGGFAAPLKMDAVTFAGQAGTGLAVEDTGDVTLGAVSTGGGNFLVRAADTLTLNNGTTLSAGAGNVILVADGAPGISVVGTPTISSRFLIYAVNASLTDPPVIKNQQGKPAIGSLVADVLDSPRNFNSAVPDPFGDTSDYFVFRAEANPPTDPSLFIDIPMELYRPVSINFGEYDPTKFGEVGDLWMSSSELYEMERKAGKGTNAVPGKVDKSKYITNGR